MATHGNHETPYSDWFELFDATDTERLKTLLHTVAYAEQTLQFVFNRFGPELDDQDPLADEVAIALFKCWHSMSDHNSRNGKP